MRYCPSCQRLAKQDIERCPYCRKQLKRKIEDTDPVFLLETSILESERLAAALDDEGIPYASRTPKKEPSATIVTGNKNASVNVFVPFHALEKARDLAIGIGMLPVGQEEQSADIPSQEENTQSEDGPEEMSRGKRLAVRIVSVILFILVVWAVVAGTDYIMNLIKSLW